MGNHIHTEEHDEVYITYVLDLEDGTGCDFAYPCMRRVSLKGEIRSWKTGEFELENGEKIHGVRIIYTQLSPHMGPDAQHPVYRSILQEIVEIPPAAQNIQVHLGSLPSIYEEAFNAAV